MEIYFVTGKGGVGKSVIAASLALSLSRKGVKTLLVEIGSHSFFEMFFSLKQSVSYKPCSLNPFLDLALWSGAECFKEYSLHILKIKKLYELLFENSVARALIQAAPALEELAILGKLTSGIRKVGPSLSYDKIVVDAFASGHFMALLSAPQGLSKAIRYGPMGEQTKDILQLLHDPSLVHYKIVLSSEELALIEGLELGQQIFDLTQIQPQFYLNKTINEVISIDPSEGAKDLSSQGVLRENGVPNKEEFLNFLNTHYDRQRKARQMLKGTNYIVLPKVLSLNSWMVVEKLSKVFDDQENPDKEENQEDYKYQHE